MSGWSAAGRLPLGEAKRSLLLWLIGSMMTGVGDWIEVGAAIHAGAGVVGGLGKGGLIVLIVVSVIAIVAFVWIFRETGKRD